MHALRRTLTTVEIYIYIIYIIVGYFPDSPYNILMFIINKDLYYSVYNNMTTSSNLRLWSNETTPISSNKLNSKCPGGWYLLVLQLNHLTWGACQLRFHNQPIGDDEVRFHYREKNT